MANVLFAKAKEQFLSAGINLTSVTVKAVIVDVDVYADDNADVFLSDLSGVVATSAALSSKTVTDGTFSSANASFTGVSGSPTERLYLYVDTGTPSTSRLISRHDCTFTPNGSDMTATMPVGGWFSL